MKWVLWALALIGIVVSGFSFSAWYYGVAVAILILAVQQLFEKTIFEYTAIHVTALPKSYDPKQWLAMGYAFASSTDQPDIVGPVFQDQEYAQEILGVLKSWNYGQPTDPMDYIKMSLIVESEDSYSFYLYPASRRPREQKFFEEYETEKKGDKHGKRLQCLVFSMTFCKQFPLTANSLMPIFIKRNSATKDFLLTTFYKEGDEFVPLINSGIIKSSYKLKNRDALAKTDYERGHGMRIMKLTKR